MPGDLAAILHQGNSFCSKVVSVSQFYIGAYKWYVWRLVLSLSVPRVSIFWYRGNEMFLVLAFSGKLSLYVPVAFHTNPCLERDLLYKETNSSQRDQILSI